MKYQSVQLEITSRDWVGESKYCQAVSEKNRIQRTVFARLCQVTEENFDHSIFLDEFIVQSNCNASRIWYQPFPDEDRLGIIGRYKHLQSVHCIGAISRLGPTSLLLFTGKLNAPGFQDACDHILVPFIENNFPDYHQLHMDNARPHTAVSTEAYLDDKNIFHFKTPAQSPDLNPIELVWHDLKVYIAEQVKQKIF